MQLVYITLGWTLGILLSANNPGASPFLWLIVALVAVLMAWLLRDDDVYRTGFIVLAALAFGGARMSFVPISSDVARYNNTGGLTIEGVVIDAPDVRDDRIQLRVNVDTVTQASQTFVSDGVVLVYAPRTATEIRYGDTVAVTGLMITPAEFDTFSYADFLARGGIFSIMQNAAVETLSRGGGNPLYAGLIDLRYHAAAAIANGLPEPQAGLLMGILLGEERGIAPEIADAFSAVGAAHVIAISGFNMAILSAAVMGILKRAQVSPRVAAVIGISMIAIYTIFVGANAAVIRAAIMSSLLVIAPLFKRKTYVPASIAFVALLMTLQNPTVVWDIGFQLSVFATLGLTLFVEPISKRFESLLYRLFPARMAEMVGNFLAEPIVVTLAASITTLPLIALYFSRLSLVMLPVNLLIVPVQAILLIVGLIATIIALIIPAVGQALFWLTLPLLVWTIDIVRLFARLSFADIEFHVDPRLVALFFILLLGSAMAQATQPDWLRRVSHFLRQRLVMVTTVFSGLSTAVLIGAVFFSYPDGNLHVWFLDVGHSNAVLIQTPRGANILIDGGRFPSRLLTEIGDRLPFTDRTIEVLVITQPDEFEISALPAVLGRYEVSLALYTGQPNQGESFLLVQDALASSQVLAVRAGYTLELDDGVRIEVLHPQTQPEIDSSFDDNAIVLRVSMGEIAFLLTSDLSFDGQNMLLAEGEYPLATVMQLPQHGTARSLSNDFLAAVQPSAAVVQIDPANRRGDPNADVLALLSDTPVFRTDQSGTLHFWTDGTSLWSLAENN